MDRDYNNRKPYRTREQKKLARETAVMVDGRWVSDAPVSYHSVRKELMRALKEEK